MAVANYIIRRFKEARRHINKTKLQNILAYAHIEYILAKKKPLVTEKICLMHFGFIFRSIADIFSSLDYDEDIGPDNYTDLEKLNDIRLREKTIERDLKDRDLIEEVALFLDKIIAKMLIKSDAQIIRCVTAEGHLWHTIANKKLGGIHLIKDYTELSNNTIYSYKKHIR